MNPFAGSVSATEGKAGSTKIINLPVKLSSPTGGFSVRPGGGIATITNDD